MNRSEEDLVPNWTENTKQGTNVRRGGSSLSLIPLKSWLFSGCYSHKKRNKILLILRNKIFFHLFFFKTTLLVFLQVHWHSRERRLMSNCVARFLKRTAVSTTNAAGNNTKSAAHPRQRCRLTAAQRITQCAKTGNAPGHVTVTWSAENPLLEYPPWSKQTCRLRAVSLFSWSVEQNARDTQMTTRVTEGARWGSFFSSRAAALASQLSRARGLPLLNPKKKRGC